MPNKLKLRIIKDADGMVRPFINDWNVWTLKKSEFTTAVRFAILHAYRLGIKHTVEDIQKHASRLTTGRVDIDGDWKL